MIKSSALYVFGNLANASVPFLLLPFLVRVLDAVEFNETVNFQIVFTGCVLIITYQTDAFLMREYSLTARDEQKISLHISRIMFVILMAAITTIIVIMCVATFTQIFSSGYLTHAFLAALSALCFSVIRIRIVTYQMQFRPLNFIQYQITLAIVNLLTSYIFVQFVSASAEARIISIFITYLGGALIALVSLKISFNFRFEIMRLSELTTILQYCSPLIPYAAALYAFNVIDRSTVNFYLNENEVQIFVALFQLALGVAILAEAVNKAFVPIIYKYLANADTNEIKKTFSRLMIIPVSILIFVPVISTLGEFIITIILGEQFKKYNYIFVLLCSAQLIWAYYLIFVNFVFFYKETKILSVLTITTAILHMLLSVMLCNYLGLMGAAYSFLVAMCIRFVSITYLARRLVNVRSST